MVEVRGLEEDRELIEGSEVVEEDDHKYESKVI